MKIALIGTGYWGRNHAKVWRELKDEGKIEDVILCDINEDAVKPLAKDFGFSYSTDPREVMEREDIDAVDIASSTPSHYSLAKNAMLQGKHVLVEKPMAFSIISTALSPTYISASGFFPFFMDSTKSRSSAFRGSM